jgi:hypothetical protein
MVRWRRPIHCTSQHRRREDQRQLELIEKIEEWEVAEEALTAFPAEAAEEELLERDPNLFDEVVDDEDVGDDTAEILQQEQDMLEELPLPGTPEHEKDRRRATGASSDPKNAYAIRTLPQSTFLRDPEGSKLPARVFRFVQVFSS